MQQNLAFPQPSFDLNPEQQHAATPAKGIFLVCAGAGSGKTRVITARMLNLMDQGVMPSAIVALTFTNKAAQEMKERIIARRGMVQGIPTVGTFHSYCLRLLKTYGHALGIPEFSILDDDDQEKLLRRLINHYGLQKKITPRHIASIIGSVKNESVTGIVDFSAITDQTMRELCLLYEREKKLAHCFDFDDLLLETLKLFHANSMFKEQFQARVRHLLIDEYQDTNHVQHALLKAIALDNEKKFALDSLCVVGDEDQAIYSWRGATVSNIINFARDFPGTVRFTIEQNYRSVQSILNVANGLIEHNTQRTPKKLWSERKGNDRVRLLACASSYQESDIIAACTKLHQARSPQRSIAVLYRSHYQSRALEESLIRHSLPYVIIGGIRFYERQEIKDLLAYLRLIVNPFDRISFMRVINVPARTLGDKFQEQFLQLWDQHSNETFLSIAALMRETLSPSKQEALKSFIDCFADLEGTNSAHDTLTSIVTRISYLVYLATAFEPDEATTKKDNVKELIHSVRALEERNNGTMSVAAFLDEVALLQDALREQDQHQEQQCIRLMTLHAAKGLEFDMVMLTGLEEGVLPSNHNLYDPLAIEEERRLLYVGITRARERLLMTHARYRAQYGTMNDQVPSRFIKEITKENLHYQDCSSLGMSQLTKYLSDWFLNAAHPSPRRVTSKRQPDTNVSLAKNEPCPFYLKQKVKHDVFGNGTIEHIEAKSDSQMIYLTVAFRGGMTKKVAASFIKPLL